MVELAAAGVPVHYLGKRRGFDPRVYPRLRRVMRSFGPAIVHTHSPYATTLAVLGYPIPSVHYMIASLGVTRIEIAPYATYGTPELAASVRDNFTAPARAIPGHNTAGGGTCKKRSCNP